MSGTITKNSSDPTLAPYKAIFEEISVVNGLLLKGKRIIVPKELQAKGPSIKYVRFRGWVGGTTKSVFLCTGVGG